jgi:pimeloyl-ACP methyl ester carboxylesterase
MVSHGNRERPSASLTGMRILVLALVLAALVPIPAAKAASSLAWSDCGDGLQCATAQVPLDYDQPNGRQISLALIKRPATDPAHRIGSLFTNPGGPGNSGVDFVRNDAPGVYTPAVLARFDVIGFDPRGVGQSARSRPPTPSWGAAVARATATFSTTSRRRTPRATWTGYARRSAIRG